jgi:hypothetical protein
VVGCAPPESTSETQYAICGGSGMPACTIDASNPDTGCGSGSVDAATDAPQDFVCECTKQGDSFEGFTYCGAEAPADEEDEPTDEEVWIDDVVMLTGAA